MHCLFGMLQTLNNTCTHDLEIPVNANELALVRQICSGGGTEDVCILYSFKHLTVH